MMRSLMFAAAAASLVAGAALAQDAPPPGCKWMGDGSLACKDGEGHWRRSGDDQIVGTYAVAKPKPKPRPAVVASSAPVAAAPIAAAPVAAAPTVSLPPLPPVPEPPPVAGAGTEADLPPVPAELQAAAAAAEPPAAVEPAPEAPKPWWRRWLDSLWRDIQAFLRLFGLGG